MAPWCESNLGLKVEAVQGKQWTETSGGLWEWWHDPGVPLAFPVESASSSDATGTPGILSRQRRERIPPGYEAETGHLWMWEGLSCFLSSGVGNVAELLQLQQGVKDPLEVPQFRCD